MIGANLGLFEQRRDQAIGGATMVGAFADSIDARVIGLQGVVDQDAAIARDAGLFRQLAVGADARGHHHQVGGDHLTVLELDRTDPTLAVVEQFGGVLGQEKLQATAFQRALQQGAGGLVQLALHQPVTDVHHGDVHAPQLEAVGRFQAEQAAADDHRVFVGLGGFHHHLGVGNVAVADYALQVLAGNRQDERIGTGCDEQAVVYRLAAVIGDHPAFDAVDLHHLAVEH